MRVKIQMDRNGNKVVTIPGNEAGRGFSIQTNGVLYGVNQRYLGWHNLHLEHIEEIRDWIGKWGTQRQMNVLIEATK